MISKGKQIRNYFFAFELRLSFPSGRFCMLIGFVSGLRFSNWSVNARRFLHESTVSFTTSSAALTWYLAVTTYARSISDVCCFWPDPYRYASYRHMHKDYCLIGREFNWWWLSEFGDSVTKCSRIRCEMRRSTGASFAIRFPLFSCKSFCRSS